MLDYSNPKDGQLDSEEALFYIVNLSHSRRDMPYISVWRPDCRGYAYPLSWAGKYPESEVRASLFYFNCGENVAVPCHVLDYMAIDPKPGLIDHDAGPVVPSSAANWRRLLANTIEPTKRTPKPMYRGMPRVRRAKPGGPTND